MDEMVGPIEMDVSSGKVSLDLPKNASVILKSDISSGHINNQFPLKNSEAVKKSLKGTYRSGKRVAVLIFINKKGWCMSYATPSLFLFILS
jgi:hypothetical protein